MKNRKTALAIGNFDGVHKGHRTLLARAKEIADEKGLPLSVLTFEPHPRSFFNPASESFRLTPKPVKERLLGTLSVDHIEALAFDAALAGMDAARFVDEIIVNKMNAVCVVVGADFHFGKNRGGDVETLKVDQRFETLALGLEQADGQAVSSTRIRECLQKGDIAAANELLGWEWEMEGEVGQGDKRGRELGYPTANIDLGETLAPSFGIYAVRVDTGDGVWRMGAASIGIRPMFEVKKPLLEVFVIDFEGDLYGRTLRVRLVQKLREEARFDTLEALKTRISEDVREAETILKASIPS